MSTEQKNAFQLYNERQLSRIYPHGMRVNSSNYDPVIPWQATTKPLIFSNWYFSLRLLRPMAAVPA